MPFLKKLFGGGGGDAPVADVVEYNGFRILPEPIPEEGQFRLAARIEAEIGGETKTHHLIRADLIRDREQAVEAAIAKAKQMIDFEGDRIFR